MYNVEMTTFAGILTGLPKYIVPEYQRSYVWKEQNWSDMWKDLKTVASTPGSEHFTGVVVLEKVSETEFRIVDGQQRLITYLVIVCAILREANRRDCADKDKIAGYADQFLHLPGAEKNYRLVPGGGSDRSQLGKICEHALGSTRTGGLAESKSFLADAYEYFSKKASEEPCGGLLTSLKTVSTRFRLGKVQIDPDMVGHSAYFFECLNNRGRQLTAFDQLRNSIFLKSGPKASDYYNCWWRHFDDDAWWKEQIQNDLLRLVVPLRCLSFSGSLPTDASEAFSYYLKKIPAKDVGKEIKIFHAYSLLYREEVEGKATPDPLGVVRFMKGADVGVVRADTTWLPVVLQLRRVNCRTCRENMLLLVEKYLIFGGLVSGINSINEPTDELMKEVDSISKKITSEEHHCCKTIKDRFRSRLDGRRPPYPKTERQIKGELEAPISKMNPFERRLISYVLYKLDLHLREKPVVEPSIDIVIERHPDWKWEERFDKEFDRIGAYSVHDGGGSVMSHCLPCPTSFTRELDELGTRRRDLQNSLLSLWSF